MSLRGKRVLVTGGGGGFIGSHLARRFLSEGARVWILDNFSTGYRANVPNGVDVLELDLRNPRFPEALPAQGVDIVCHLAAQSSGEISREDPVADLETNLLGTVRLLTWASQRCSRFVFASSMAVYGQPGIERLREEEFPAPLSFYGLGKWAAECYVGKFRRPDFLTHSLRLFSVYGPGQNLENMKQGMVSIYLAYALRDDPVLVKGSPDRFRDFVYIDDVVDAFLRLLLSPTGDSVYNVGTGCKTTVREVIQRVFECLGKGSTGSVVEGRPTPDDQFGVVADNSRIQRDLGWIPQVGLNEGLNRMVRWALEGKR